MVTLGVAAAAAAVLAVPGGVHAEQPPAGPACAPGGPPAELAGAVTSDDARTYQVHPFEVGAGTTRIEVTYDWSDTPSQLPGNPVMGLVQTVVDAGVRDQAGYRETDGFRGWSGSRQGRVGAGQAPIVIQQDAATRGYRPAPIEPGTWWLELGFAVVAPDGASWTATVTCTDPDVGPAFEAAPVDPDLVVDPRPGWYHADLHVHGFHSAGNAPAWDDIVEQARTAGLEVLPVTEYVTGQHWNELGPVQDRNPDLLLWPGREIITYFGHALALGETRSTLEYRHGFEDVTMASIQADTLADGALFGVAHPTFFPGPLADLCRGCEYTLDAVTDWSQVDTIEVLTGPALATADDVGVPFDPGARIANPFLRTAIERWEDLLQAGYRVTAVSGSDSKANEPPVDRERLGIGSSATAIRAESLSRQAVAEGLRAGRAYVRSFGANRSPTLDVVATAPDGATAGIGDELAADEASLEITVTGGAGDTLVVTRNARDLVAPILVTADPFTTTVHVVRDPRTEGPLGTWVRVDTIRAVEIVDGVALPDRIVNLPLDVPAEVDVLRVPTTIANPVLLTGESTADGPPARRDPPGRPEAPGRPDAPGRPAAADAPTQVRPAAGPLPVTGSSAAALGLAMLAVAARLRGRDRRS